MKHKTYSAPHIALIAFLLIALILFNNQARAQITVDWQTHSAYALVDTLIKGDCGKFRNVVFSKGNNRQYGYFTDATSSTGFNSGVIISTGNSDNLSQPPGNQVDRDWGSAGDADLNTLLAGSATSQDAVVLEFDFTAQTNTVTFDYVFMSEEYPEYVGSMFNDVFGFFISGPGITNSPGLSGYNMALVPGTNTFVAINSVNGGCSAGVQVNGQAQAPVNANYYVHNANNGLGGNVTNNFVIFDGYTKVLTAVCNDLIPCQEYHMKLVVGDAGDGIYDSAVLLKTNSFGVGSNFQVSSFTSEGASPDAYEGCSSSLIFTLPVTEDNDKVINYTVSGTATSGSDYNPLSGSVTIPAGSLSDSIEVTTIFDNLVEGIETVIISTDTGCICNLGPYSYTLNIHDVDSLRLTMPDLNICLGSPATLDASGTTGGKGIYTYQWSNNLGTNATATVSPATTTTYAVIVTDECGNSVSSNVTVNVELPPNPGSDNTALYCQDANISNLFPLLGTPDTTGIWSGPSNLTNGYLGTFQHNTNTAGNYTYSVTGTLCPAQTANIFVNFSVPTYTENITPPNCGASDGAITLTASNGQTPYQFSIDGGATSNTTGSFTGLGGGTYNISISDNLGCVVNGTATLQNLAGVTINSSQNINVSCNGVCDGSIAINATNATEFSINGGAFTSSNTFNNLCAGIYNLLAQDNNGCQATAIDTVLSPAPVTFTQTTTHLLCNSICNGKIILSASGGTPPYTYSINGGTSFQNVAAFNNLCAGTYNIVINDVNNCSANGTITVTEPSPLAWLISSDSVTCPGMCDGWITCLPSGGVSPYYYNWSPASINADQPSITNLCMGSYGVRLTDANGCTIDTNNIIIDGPSPVNIDSLILTQESCFASCDATITIIATGATEYSFDGSTYSSNNTFTGLCAGTYTIYVKDGPCEVTQQFAITGPSEIVLTVSPDTTICIGGIAQLSASASGGNGQYTFAWDSGDNTQNIQVNPTSNATYCVTATDINGCNSQPECTNVFLHPALTVQAYTDQTICEGASANLSALANGGIGAPYTYTWDQTLGTGQNQIVSPLNSTTYMVTVNDGCESPAVTSTVTITVSQIPIISFYADTTSGCIPTTVQFSSVNVPNGSSCFWNFGDGSTGTECNTISHTFIHEGCWDISLTITTPDNCEAAFALSDYVCTYPYPEPYFTSSPNDATTVYPVITFDNQTPGNNSYNWNFGGTGNLVNDNDMNPSYNYINEEGASYLVCLEAVTAYNCPATYCDSVTIYNPFLVYVPNAFTPNNEGPNNTFYPVVTGVNPEKYEFMIFNRWGQMVFESGHQTLGWDGRYKGTMSQTDVYVWKLLVTDFKGKKHEYVGHVSLLK